MINSFYGKYEFLSNFYVRQFYYKGILQKSSEHAYHTEKTICEDERIWIASSETPYIAKRRGGPKGDPKTGRKITLRSDWDAIKISIMADIVFQKFLQNPDLLKQLIETGEEELVEGNWWHDIFWGVCNGVGENHLGKILMEIRENLK